MKIALVTDGIYPYVLGGMQKHSYYLAKFLARSGCKVTVFHCLGNSEEQYRSYFTDSELTNLSFVEINFPKLVRLPGHYLRASKQYGKSIANYISKHNLSFDFYYTKGFSGRYLVLNKRKLNAPVAVQLHGLEMFQAGGGFKQKFEKWMLKPITLKVIRGADFVFTYGGKIKTIIEDKGVESSKIILQHGAADEFWLKSIDSDFTNNTILFVGRFEHRKGHHLINEAIPQIMEDYTLHIVGEVPEEKKLVDSRIQYHGNQNAEGILDLMKQTSFLLVPSLAEGFPTIIVEGMAQGLIPIATDVGAVKEIVNSNNGFLLESITPKSLVVTLKNALSLPKNERLRLRKNARQQVEQNYNWPQTATLLLKDINNCFDSWKRTNS